MSHAAPHGRIVIVGPDGTGKSTLVDRLTERASEGGIPVRRGHWRPGLIRPHAGRQRGPVRDPHERRARGPLSTIVRLVLFTIDQVLGLLGPWRRASRHGLLIVERGWFDMAVDPRRYRLPAWASHLVLGVGRALPRAGLTVLLTGDPSILHARTGEIGTTETARQLERWRELAPRTARRVVEIDTTRNDPSTVADTAWMALLT